MAQHIAEWKSLKAFVLPAILLIATVPACGQIRLSVEDAAKLIVEKPEAIYPPLAKQLRLQGTVKADVTVSEAGVVGSTKLISGHPMLVTAAMDTVKKYTYKPYLVGGKPVPFVTIVEVSFSIGIPKKEYDDQQAINQKYFKEADKCQDLRKKQQWPEAEEVCKAAIPLAEQLEGQGLTKMLAHESVGHVLLAQGRLQEALDYYTRAFAFAQSSLNETDAEMAVDVSQSRLGQQSRARKSGQSPRVLRGKAETTLQVARDNIGKRDFLKRKYEEGIKEEILKRSCSRRRAGGRHHRGGGASKASGSDALTVMFLTDPGKHRWQLGFKDAVLSDFKFLTAYGLKPVQEDVTLVRYESDVVFCKCITEGVRLTQSPSVANDRILTANRTLPGQKAQRDYPGSAFVFHFWQCDKKNHAGVKAHR